VKLYAQGTFRSVRTLGAPSISVLLAALMAACAVCGAGCNEERKQECDKLLTAIRPLKEGTPTSAIVDHVAADVSAISFQDQPLGVYATNYKQTLTVLGSTLKLKEGAASADAVPDGTEDVIKKNLAVARTDDDDIARYCAP